MPFAKPFSKPATGESWPNAFWYAAALVIDYINLSLSLLYRGHNSPQDLMKAPVDAMEHRMTTSPEQTRQLLRQLAEYQLTPEEWAAMVIPGERKINVTVLMAMICDKVALTILDTPNGKTGEDGKPVLVSFFNGIQPLPPDLSVLK